MSNEKSVTKGESDAPGMTFPCDVDIKIFAQASEDLESRIREILGGLLPHEQVIAVTRRASRQGNYHALSCRVHAADRAQIDRVFEGLSAHPDILMVI